MMYYPHHQLVLSHRSCPLIVMVKMDWKSFFLVTLIIQTKMWAYRVLVLYSMANAGSWLDSNPVSTGILSFCMVDNERQALHGWCWPRSSKPVERVERRCSVGSTPIACRHAGPLRSTGADFAVMGWVMGIGDSRSSPLFPVDACWR